jgi:hypothetical protein
MEEYEWTTYFDCTSCSEQIQCNDYRGRFGNHDDCDMGSFGLCEAERCMMCDEYYHHGLWNCQAGFGSYWNIYDDITCKRCDEILDDPVETEKFQRDQDKWMEENNLYDRETARLFYEAHEKKLKDALNSQK